MSDILKTYGEVCSIRDCSTCLIGAERGDLSCPEFLSKFPDRASVLINQMANQKATYYNEFCKRFPKCNIGVEVLAECICRKAAFEGYLDCQDGDCVACWKEEFAGDVTVHTQEISEDDDFDAQAVIDIISQNPI